MFFWTGAAQVAAKLETMRSAEARLVSFAQRFGGRDPLSFQIELFDTDIPYSVLPFEKQDGEDLVMHGIRVSNTDNTDDKGRTSTPLVLLHGYMNGALYFYRNLVGLTSFYQTVFSLDMMGWGLSSRPKFCLKDDSVETAEAFFVESLEAWRSKNKIEKMTLAGHSMGGYLSVAYCEKYPERVECLILLSPVGVPERDLAETERKRARIGSSFGRRMFINFYSMMFDRGSNPASILRAVPESRSRSWVTSYVENRLPAISHAEERQALTEYLHSNTMLPGSGEYALNHILHFDAYAKKPAVHRIPKLKVPRVSFLYGEQDWMDPKGGLEVQDACRELRATGQLTPKTTVYSIKNAGHLLMLDNWEEFNSAVMLSGGGEHALSRNAPMPSRIAPVMETAYVEELLNEISSTPSVEVQV